VTPEEFVAAVETVAYSAAVRGTLSGLQQPPGRSPGNRALALQEWYGNLGADDQAMVAAVVRQAAHFGVFQFVYILDGACVIDDPPHVELRLIAVESDGTESVLNDPSLDLHDEFNALVHPLSEKWPA
jgi:hypothetical protein